jgi:tRNA U34 5-carboxymethylaminomethyl modifying enzyme MnmG/GidA
MALRDRILKRGMELMQDPKVAKLVQDERVMKVAMQAFQLRSKVQDQIDDRVEQVAKSLGLVTKNEVKELRRTIKKLENEIEKTKKVAQEARAPKGA